MQITVQVHQLVELRSCANELMRIVRLVKQANGQYVLYVDRERPNSPGTQSVFITKGSRPSSWCNFPDGLRA